MHTSNCLHIPEIMPYSGAMRNLSWQAKGQSNWYTYKFNNNKLAGLMIMNCGFFENIRWFFDQSMRALLRHVYVMWLLTKQSSIISKVIKWDILLQLLSSLDVNSAKCKAFDGLAIQVDNLLVLWDNEDKNYGYKTWCKNLSIYKKKLGEENFKLSRVTEKKISQPRNRQEKKISKKKK